MSQRRRARRQFLQASGAIGAGYFISSLRAEPKPNHLLWPSEKIRMASIGVGGKGGSDCEQAGQVGEMLAICDIDTQKLDQMGKRFPNAKKYVDFRKLLDEMGKDIDAVTVSGPDHMHAAAALMAMRMGKHAYVQKPLVRTVYEARLVREVATQMKVCTQMGNQGTAGDGVRQAAEIVQSGALGNVTEIHVWTNRPVWPQAPGITARPNRIDPVPEHIKWDLWLGPAQWRPFVGKRTYHDFNWRGWWDFGTGAMGDMACHTANMAFMACKLTQPTKVAAESGVINAETFPEWAKITYDFPAREGMGPCKLIWYEGKRDGKKVLPPEDLLAKCLKPGETLADSGSILVGDKGILFSPNDYGEKYFLLPEATFEGYKPPTPSLPRNGQGDQGMKNEWAQAIRENKPSIAMSNFDYAGNLTEAMLVGNIALRLGKNFDWDTKNLKAVGVPEADCLIKPEYRKGWVLDV